jgi:hypothetical protein
VRRALPWALVGLVGAGTALGAGVGLGMQGVPTLSRLSQVLHATESAGTARFTVTERTTSTSPGLRSDFSESGEINFETGDFDVTTIDPSSGSRAGSAGGSERSEMRIIATQHSLRVFEKGAGIGSFGSRWAKDNLSPGPQEKAELYRSFGPFAGLDVSGSSRLTRLENVGPLDLRDDATTEYRLRQATCQSKTTGGSFRVSSTPTSIWVDSEGRWVQGESTVTIRARTSTRSGTTNSRSTTTITDRLFDFGTRVNVTVPVSENSGLALFFDDGKCLG